MSLCIETLQRSLTPLKSNLAIPKHLNEQVLRDYLKDRLGVTIPDVAVCPNHSSPWSAFKAAFFAEFPVIVMKASRGFGGKSYMLAALGMAEATLLKADVNILGGSGAQSRKVHGYTTNMWNSPSAPRELLASDPAQWHTRLTPGNEIIALTASQGSVRGPHPQRLRLDEVDEMSWAIYEAASGQTMGKTGIPAQTIISSTHQYADGTMTAILKLAKEKGWPVFEWCYKESSAEPHGWLDSREIERKKSEVTANMWAVEYELQEPTFEGRAFVPEMVDATFSRDTGEYTGSANQYIEIEPPNPSPDVTYVTAADWARKQDWTIILTYRTDIRPYRLVAFERTARRPWKAMVARYDARMQRYPGKGIHDETGLGDVVKDLIQSDGVVGFIFSQSSKRDVISEYVAALEAGLFACPFIEYMYSEHFYASTDDLYGTGHVPDTIAAGAMAYRVIKRYSHDPLR